MVSRVHVTARTARQLHRQRESVCPPEWHEEPTTHRHVTRFDEPTPTVEAYDVMSGCLMVHV